MWVMHFNQHFYRKVWQKYFPQQTFFSFSQIHYSALTFGDIEVLEKEMIFYERTDWRDYYI